jgi:hypothetical protein
MRLQNRVTWSNPTGFSSNGRQDAEIPTIVNAAITIQTEMESPDTEGIEPGRRVANVYVNEPMITAKTRRMR